MSADETNEIVVSVGGLPPSKNGPSIASAEHRHHTRVVELLRATQQALPAEFVPFRTAVRLKVTVFAPTPAPPGDPTNFLGGVADALQRKAFPDDLGALAHVVVYENDLQLRRVEYEQRVAPETSYELRIQSLGGPILIGDGREAGRPESPVVEIVVDVVERDDLALAFVNVLERARRRDLVVDDALSLLAWLRFQRALPDSFLDNMREAVITSSETAIEVWGTATRLAQALQRLFLGQREEADVALITEIKRAGARFELVDLDSTRPSLATAELRGAEVGVVFWPILWSALTLLRAPIRDRIGVCHEETCKRLFVDRTKNASKTWCSSTCGTRAKVRSYRMRHSGLEESALTYVVD
jgi:predicted RNA-binding Zn ribbon-like protein